MFLKPFLFAEAGEGDGGTGAGGGNDGGAGDGGVSGSGDVQSGDWRASLPDDLKGEASLQDYKTVADLAKSHVSAQKMVGADKVVVPGKDASVEEQDAFFTKLGRPETSDKYEFAAVEGVGEDLIPADAISKFQAEAHRLGLSQRQASGLYDWFAKDTQGQVDTRDAEGAAKAEENLASLQTEWGEAYDEKLDLAKKAVAEFGGEELGALMDETGAGNDPRAIKAFAKIGRAMADDQLYGAGAELREGFKMSPEEARRKIGELQRDEKFMEAYMSNEHAGHPSALEEMTKLMQSANPA